MPSVIAKRSWQRRSAARPAELRDAALRLFAQRGYAATTIEDIARAAEVTVGTVYRYFTDKASLFAALVDLAADVPLAAPDTAASLRDQVEHLWSAARSTPHAELLRILVAESGQFPALAERYRDRVLEPLAADWASRPEFADRPEPLLQARAVLAQVLGASLLAGWPPHVPPLLPQLSPREITLERILLGATGGSTLPRPGDTPRPLLHRPAGPEAW